MTTAFQPDGFQGDAFQIGAPSPPVTLDEIVPQIGAAIISTIAISGWVFAGTPNPLPNYASMEPTIPPLHAPRAVQRPYEDTYFRFPNDAQSAIGLEEPARPAVIRKSIPRPDHYVFTAQTAVMGLQEPLRPVTIPTRRAPITVLLPSDVFIPPAIAASYPHTGPQPILVPGAPTRNFAFVDEAFIFVPLTPPGTDYPVGLEPPIRPIPGAPRRYPRIDQNGTVGVFFYSLSQPFDWNDLPARPPFTRPQIRRPEPDVFIAAAVAPTYDYGWFAPPRLPIQPKPSNATRLAADVFITQPGGTYDYGWYSAPQLPVRPKESSSRLLTPDTIYPTTGNTYDFGWYAPPRLPIRPAGSNAIFSEADNFLIPPSGTTYDYGWAAFYRLPMIPFGSKAINLIPDYWPWEVAVPTDIPHFGGWPHKKGGHLKKKKRKDIPAFEDRLPTARQTLLQVLADIQERQDEEDILMILKKIYDS